MIGIVVRNRWLLAAIVAAGLIGAGLSLGLPHTIASGVAMLIGVVLGWFGANADARRERRYW